MIKYQVSRNYNNLGIVEAATEQDAKDEVCKKMGYESERDLVGKLEQPSGLQVTFIGVVE